MRATRILLLIVTGSATIAGVVLWPGSAYAYTQWSINDDATYCGECHGDFRSDDYISPVDGENWGNLHDLHRETMLKDDCDTCHLANDKFPVMLNESAGGKGLAPVSCMGCHGIDPDPGTSNTDWGAGLRLHHLNAGVRADRNGFTCLNCHPNDPMPPAENVLPAFYLTPDTNHPDKPTDPCNPAPDHPEHFAGLTLGIDNDGDLLYDLADSDCGDLHQDGFESGDTTAWSITVQ